MDKCDCCGDQRDDVRVLPEDEDLTEFRVCPDCTAYAAEATGCPRHESIRRSPQKEGGE